MVEDVRPQLAQAVRAGVPPSATYVELAQHPLAVWVELTLGLTRDEDKWRRARPMTLDAAAERLAADAGVEVAQAKAVLADFLLLAYRTTDKPPSEGGRSLFAFKLHQFISGGSKVYGTLEPPGRRYLTLEGSQFVPGERARRLYALHFCRECGQEYIPVWDEQSADGRVFHPRHIEERSHDEEDVKGGYFMPDVSGVWDDTPDRYPETWLEVKNDGDLKLRASYKKRQPQFVKIDAEGRHTSDGMPGWFIPGSFGFCLRCGVLYSTSGKESLRLTGLSGEGRSSVTTMLTLSALRYLYEEDDQLPAEAKKILGFTDNRQDAALQAGHFNDFLQVLLQRAALLAAVQKAGGRLGEAEVANAVFEALGFDRDDPGVRAEYMQDPDVKGNARRQAQDTMRTILGYRVYYDLRRGWRYNNPNLEQLGLVHIDYQDLDDLAADTAEWSEAPAALQAASPRVRKQLLITLFDTMRQDLCIASRYLDRRELDGLKTASYANLREPWGFSEDETPVASNWFIVGPKPRDANRRNVDYLVSGSARSKLGRELKRPSRWREPDGRDNPHAVGLKDDECEAIIHALLKAAKSYGLVKSEETEFGLTGYQLNGTSLLWTLGEGKSQRGADDNAFFRTLYANIAQMLANPAHRLFDFEAREHTAQVEQDERLEREARFRFTPKDRADWHFFRDPVRMVHGQVNPPTLDLANRELIQSHLHAIWLAETGTKLPNSVRGLLNMNDPAAPLSDEYRQQMDADAPQKRAHTRGLRVLAMLQDELTPQKAPWYTPTFADEVFRRAFQTFDRALDRWRDLFAATKRQMEINQRVMNNPAASERDRLDAKQRHDEAFSQQMLLQESGSTINSDFYTYRYLASQGFLPGYNFPRLPLMAYLPARKGKIGRENFLSRPRFLALSEFGPYSLIYHEGSQYELTYTAHDLKAWAADLGHDGPPFAWDPERRAQLRAELDAYYARLYGLTRDELRYILDPADVMGEDYPSETFRVLKTSELRQFGEYRTQRLVLAAWDALASSQTLHRCLDDE